jgi:hypothetical protein
MPYKLDFNYISQSVPFVALLTWLAVPFKEENGYLKGEGFSVNKGKNLYFDLKTHTGGSVINFLSKYHNIPVKEAAQQIYDEFLDEKGITKTIPELELLYCDYLKARGISEETQKQMEFGLSNQGSAKGRIAFRIRHEARLVGHILWKIKEEALFFYKDWKNDYLWNLDKVKTQDLILTTDPFVSAHIYGLGYQNVACLMSANMTEAQENLIVGRFCMVLLLPRTRNILRRGYVRRCFSKRLITNFRLRKIWRLISNKRGRYI